MAEAFLQGIGFGVGLFVPILVVIFSALFCLWWFGGK